MSVVKNAKLVYVALNPDLKVPAHVKIQWIGDDKGRTHTMLLELNSTDIARYRKHA